MELALWHTGTKGETLMFLKEGEAKLYPDLPAIMSLVEEEDNISDWQVGVFKCRICNHIGTCVLPAEAENVDNLECSNCGNLACEPIECEE